MRQPMRGPRAGSCLQAGACGPWRAELEVHVSLWQKQCDVECHDAPTARSMDTTSSALVRRGEVTRAHPRAVLCCAVVGAGTATCVELWQCECAVLCRLQLSIRPPNCLCSRRRQAVRRYTYGTCLHAADCAACCVPGTGLQFRHSARGPQTGGKFPESVAAVTKRGLQQRVTSSL